MSATPARQLVAALVIVGGVCVGGYELFAAPANHRLAAAEQRAEALRRRILEVDRAARAGPVLHRRADECRRAAETIERLGRGARDEAALFAAIESLAAEHKVTVERISPARTRATGAARNAAGADRSVGIELAVRAHYADLVRCIDRLQHGLGLCRIEAIALAPDPSAKPGAVTASIRMTAFAIDPEADATPPGEQQGGRS